jgi:hypothetical protein
VLRSRAVNADGRWLSCAALAIAIALPGCRRAPSRQTPLDAAISNDLYVLCRRAAERSIASWSQPSMTTDLVTDITVRIDLGQESARCDLGQLMRRHEPKVCKGSIPSLLASCAEGTARRRGRGL